jgi:hypothetical protein
VKPPDAIWLDAKRDGVEKTGLWLKNGDRLVEVILAYMVLTGGQGTSFAFYGSGFPIGRDLSDRASMLKATVGTSSVHSCTVGKWRMTSTFEKDGDMRWCKPAVALLGKLGDGGGKGPTVAEWRQAQTLRRAVKDGTPWQEAMAGVLASLATSKPKLTVVEPLEAKLTFAERRQAWAEGPPPIDPDDPGYDEDAHYPDQEEAPF